MKRSLGNILKDIDYFLKVRDYMVSTPMADYAMHSAAYQLVIEKLDRLQDEYRRASGNKYFLWSSWQFVRKENQK